MLDPFAMDNPDDEELRRRQAELAANVKLAPPVPTPPPTNITARPAPNVTARDVGPPAPPVLPEAPSPDMSISAPSPSPDIPRSVPGTDNTPPPQSNPMGHTLQQDRGPKARFIHAMQGALAGMVNAQQHGATGIGALVGAGAGGIMGAVKPEKADELYYKTIKEPEQQADTLKAQAIAKGGLNNQDIQEQIKMRQAQTAAIPTKQEIDRDKLAERQAYGQGNQDIKWADLQRKIDEGNASVAERQRMHDETIKRIEENIKQIGVKNQQWQDNQDRMRGNAGTKAGVKEAEDAQTGWANTHKVATPDVAAFEAAKKKGLKTGDLGTANALADKIANTYPGQFEVGKDSAGSPYVKEKPMPGRTPQGQRGGGVRPDLNALYQHALQLGKTQDEATAIIRLRDPNFTPQE